MEKNNSKKTISDSELMNLIQKSQNKDQNAMLKLIEIYDQDIKEVSKYIKLPNEDAVSQITVEFLEYIMSNNIKLEN
ncbi:hypothetical protein ACFSTH_05920 [Paenibacillus yanchengensis]|uniref:Helix-turn-helix conjugative transposon-like domain-containing protein n=1 Tax=Paenibacillus yanchengensis TaxID=2035833 RepID=A0ABW4YHJ8_9BACL